MGFIKNRVINPFVLLLLLFPLSEAPPPSPSPLELGKRVTAMTSSTSTSLNSSFLGSIPSSTEFPNFNLTTPDPIDSSSKYPLENFSLPSRAPNSTVQFHTLSNITRIVPFVVNASLGLSELSSQRPEFLVTKSISKKPLLLTLSTPSKVSSVPPFQSTSLPNTNQDDPITSSPPYNASGLSSLSRQVDGITVTSLAKDELILKVPSFNISVDKLSNQEPLDIQSGIRVPHNNHILKDQRFLSLSKSTSSPDYKTPSPSSIKIFSSSSSAPELPSPLFFTPPPPPPLPPSPSPFVSRSTPFTTTATSTSSRPLAITQPPVPPLPPSSTPNPLDMPPHVLSLFHFLLSPPPSPSPSNSSSLSLQDFPSPVFAVPQGCVPPQGSSKGNYILSLTPQAGLQYGVFLARMPRLVQFSLCIRFQLSTLARPHFLFSYAVNGQDNAILFFVSPGTKPGLGFYVNNKRTKAKVAVHMRKWHSTCVTWDSQQGQHEIYLDGVLVKKGKNQCTGCEIEGGGIAVLGVEQDRPGGGFNPRQVSHGHITSLHLWKGVLQDSHLHPHQCCSPESVKESTKYPVACGASSRGFTSEDDQVIEWGVTPVAVMGGAFFVPIYL